MSVNSNEIDLLLAKKLSPITITRPDSPRDPDILCKQLKKQQVYTPRYIDSLVWVSAHTDNLAGREHETSARMDWSHFRGQNQRRLFARSLVWWHSALSVKSLCHCRKCQMLMAPFLGWWMPSVLGQSPQFQKSRLPSHMYRTIVSLLRKQSQININRWRTLTGSWRQLGLTVCGHLISSTQSTCMKEKTLIKCVFEVLDVLESCLTDTQQVVYTLQSLSRQCRARIVDRSITTTRSSISTPRMSLDREYSGRMSLDERSMSNRPCVGDYVLAF